MIPPLGQAQWAALRNEVPLPAQGDEAGGDAADDRFARLLAQLAGARDPGSFLGAAEGTEAERGTAPAAVADIFNEHGLLAGAAGPAPPAAAVPPADASSADHFFANAEQASFEVEPAATRAGDAALGPSFEVTDGGVSRVAPAGPANSAGLAAAARRLATAGPIASPGSGEAALQPADGDAEALQRASLSGSRRAQHREASKSDARVRLEQTAEGLRVIAQASGLDREERVRLRARIAQLLAHLGLSAAEVRLNGDKGRSDACK